MKEEEEEEEAEEERVGDGLCCVVLCWDSALGRESGGAERQKAERECSPAPPLGGVADWNQDRAGFQRAATPVTGNIFSLCVIKLELFFL